MAKGNKWYLGIAMLYYQIYLKDPRLIENPYFILALIVLYYLRPKGCPQNNQSQVFDTGVKKSRIES